MPIHIFISYPTENRGIAEKLREAFFEFDRSNFIVFLDFYSIERGGEISDVIRSRLDMTNYFIGLGPEVSRGAFAWCGLELGYFLGSGAEPRSVNAIYDHDTPGLFASYNGTKMVALDPRHVAELGGQVMSVEKSPLYMLLTGLSEKLFQIHPPAHLQESVRYADSWARKWCGIITEEYYQTLLKRVKYVWYPQKRIEVKVDDGDFFNHSAGEIPKSSRVVLELSTCLILEHGLPQGQNILELSWSEFEGLLTQQTGGLQLALMVRGVINSVLPSKVEAHNDYVFRAPNEVNYRVLLVKHQQYGTGSREFVINLVETLREIPLEGDRFTSTMTASIMLASKYRFLFLEADSRYGVEKMDHATRGNETAPVRALLDHLDRINAESAQDGVGDKESLVKFFGKAQRASVEELFEKWWPLLADMRTAAIDFIEQGDSNSRADFLDKLRLFNANSSVINAKFMKLCLNAYSRHLDSVS